MNYIAFIDQLIELHDKYSLRADTPRSLKGRLILEKPSEIFSARYQLWSLKDFLNNEPKESQITKELIAILIKHGLIKTGIMKSHGKDFYPIQVSDLENFTDDETKKFFDEFEQQCKVILDFQEKQHWLATVKITEYSVKSFGIFLDIGSDPILQLQFNSFTINRRNEVVSLAKQNKITVISEDITDREYMVQLQLKDVPLESFKLFMSQCFPSIKLEAQISISPAQIIKSIGTVYQAVPVGAEHKNSGLNLNLALSYTISKPE